MFGRTAAEALRAMGLLPLVAGRRGGDLAVDANDPSSVRAALRAGDLVLDAAGPFQDRTLALVEAAIDVGFDVIDLSDDLRYAEQVLRLAAPIAKAGIRVLNACSSVSALAAFLVGLAGIPRPVRARGFLVPMSRETGNPGSALAVLRSVGREVRVWRGGGFATARGWTEPLPLGLPHLPVRGRLLESADALYLPRAWPTLRDVDLRVDTNTFGFNLLLCAAARSPAVRRLLERQVVLGTRLARVLGSKRSALAYEVLADDGRVATCALLARDAGRFAPVAPAVLAARSIAQGGFGGTGLVPPERQFDPDELQSFLESKGIRILRL
jgi:hypothetical protein